MTDATGSTDPLRVVSVSLGSSERNHAVEVELLGRRVSLERVGVDGDVGRACAMIAELDGQVAAIGLGGTDLYLVAGKRRYVLEQSRRLAQSAKATPVVDGSGLKDTLERETIRWLGRHGGLDLRGKKVLLVCAVDRFGMAEAFVEAGSRVIFGDLMFSLGLPVPVRSLRTIGLLAALFLPIIRRLPISMIYPTGGKQKQRRPKYGRFFRWADVIAGDFHFIGRYAPDRLDGKMVITNTTTADDVARLKASGVTTLVTTTPEFGGRSYGTNVMEGVIVALSGRRPQELRPEDYLDVLHRLGWEPRLAHLSAAVPADRPQPEAAR